MLLTFTRLIHISFLDASSSSNESSIAAKNPASPLFLLASLSVRLARLISGTVAIIHDSSDDISNFRDNVSIYATKVIVTAI